jgi:hypothetical protein
MVPGPFHILLIYLLHYQKKLPIRQENLANPPAQHATLGWYSVPAARPRPILIEPHMQCIYVCKPHECCF